MNIVHIKYAVEVAKIGSINKASENLGMAQPNISRAIKDLEAEFGITIFDRSAKGMNLTPEGREFIAYSQKILEQLNELERKYKGDHPGREKLSISLPGAGYISEAVSEFLQKANETEFELVLLNASAESTVKSVIDSECDLGIIRYSESYGSIFEEIFREKHLEAIRLAETEKVILLNKNSALAGKDIICKNDLEGMTEIADAESAEHLHALESLRDELHNHGERCVHVSDRLIQTEMLSENTDFYMIAPPMNKNVAERFGLVQKKYSDARIFSDVLIYRKDRKATDFEKKFLEQLKSKA